MTEIRPIPKTLTEAKRQLKEVKKERAILRKQLKQYQDEALENRSTILNHKRRIGELENIRDKAQQDTEKHRNMLSDIGQGMDILLAGQELEPSPGAPAQMQPPYTPLGKQLRHLRNKIMWY